MKTLEFPVEKFLKWFEITNPDNIFDNYLPDLNFEEYRDELRDDGLTEEQIDEKILDAEDQEIEDQTNQYRRNLESSVEKFLTSSPIRGIDSVEFDWYNGKVLVKVENLENLLSSIRDAINGYGMFYAEDNESLICVGPYQSIEEACTKLFHNLQDIPKIYGTYSVSRIMERCY